MSIFKCHPELGTSINAFFPWQNFRLNLHQPIILDHSLIPARRQV